MFCISKTVFFLYLIDFLQNWSDAAPMFSNKTECVRIQNCPHLEKILKTKRDTYAATTLLYLLHCKYENGYIYTKCPDPQEVKKFMDGAELIPNYDSCGPEGAESKISGGEQTNIDDYPWIALLKYRTANGSTTFGCHGSLITNRYVLTAAHCVDQNYTRTARNLTLTSVVLGEYDIRKEIDCPVSDDCADEIKEISVESYNVHPGFNIKTIVNDIALIRMSSEVEFTYFIKPICLPPKNLIAPFNQTLLIAGWGNNEHDQMNPVKVQARFALKRKENCQVKINAKQFCASSTHNAQTCPGDSGGPLMMRKSIDTSRLFLVGVYSRGTYCDFNRNISVYTKVSSYIEWIATTIHK